MYKEQHADVDFIKYTSAADDPNKLSDGVCDGYPSFFVREVFITLYGPGAETELAPRDARIFLRLLQETLNECTDLCVYIDEVEIAREELQKIGVLDLDFGDGLVIGQSATRTNAKRGGARDLEQIEEEDGVGSEEAGAAVAEMEV